MVRRVLGLALSLPALLLLGCGSSADPEAAASSSCGFSGPIPKTPKAAPEDASLQAYAEAQGLAALDTYLGPYLRGDVTIYKGTLSAHDNQSVLGSQGYKDQTIADGPAIASLVVTQGVAMLSVHSLALHKYLLIQQPTKNTAATTSVGIILKDEETGGNAGVCAHCVPDFGDRPETIAFDNITSTEVVNLNSVGQSNHDVTLHVYATASLDLTSACSLAFTDIAELNGSSGLSFEESSGEWVSQITGTYYSQKTYCVSTFTVDLYVNAANLADYGVRSVSSKPEEGCSSGSP
jgi:hypothetical protein